MKRYLVFVMLVFVASLKSYGANYSTIYRFKDQADQTIDNVIYNAPFKIDLVINYDGSVPADQLLINIKLPSNNYQYINLITSNVTFPIIAGQHRYDGNILTIPLTGFTVNQGFTLHLLNVNIRHNEICANTLFSFTSTMKTSVGGTVNPSFETTPSSLSITAKHSLGQIQTSFPTYQYNSTRNANQPFYVDLYYEIYRGTYPGNQILFSINGFQPIKKVVVLSTTNSVELTKDQNQQYHLPINAVVPAGQNDFGQKYSVRVYFDVTNSNFSLNLNVVSMFDISCGIVPNNSFSKSFTTPSNVLNKDDDLLLNYPSIFGSNNSYTFDLNYDSRSILISPCNKVALNFYLDNIYNQPIENTLVTTFTNLQNILIDRLVLDPVMLPTVSVKFSNSNDFQILNYDPVNSNSIIFSNPENIEAIQMSYSKVMTKISPIQMILATSAANASITYNLLKSNAVYSSFTKAIIGSQNPNYVGFLTSSSTINKKVVGISDPVTNVFYLTKQRPLKVGDYIEYKLNSAMKFPVDVETKIEISKNNFNWKFINDFNLEYVLPGDPQIQCQRIDDYTIRIINIPLKGYYSNCLSTDQSLYFRLTTIVVDRPLTTKNNINTVRLVSDTPHNQNYIWEIDVTQNILPVVTLSCNQTLFSENLTVKNGDEFSVQYMLQNIVPIKYEQSRPVFYINLLQPGVLPSLSVVQINGADFTSNTLTTSVYDISFATADIEDTIEVDYLNTLTYLPTKNATSNILKITFKSVVVDYYDKLILTATYPSGLILSNNEMFVNLSLSLGLVNPSSFKQSILTIGPKSDCDLVNCAECITSFSPIPNKEYVLSAWVKELYTGNAPLGYVHSGVRITFNNGSDQTLPLFRPTGPVVDGWQRIESSFFVPANAANIQIVLVNESTLNGADVFFDDIRIHPYNSNMKSFVYDPSTQKLTAELDENNFATLYEYDDEGILIRVKKETERGVMTIKETRSNQSKIK